MTWKDVVGGVSKFAPLLGTIIGGPVGAIVGAAGGLIAKALGCDSTPDAVNAALASNDPQIAVQLKQLEVQEQAQLLAWQAAQLQADTQIAIAQAQTNTAEAQSNDKFARDWRPLIGYICGASLGYSCIISPVIDWISRLNHLTVTAPTIDTGLISSITVLILGGGAMRTYEKVNGAASK